MLVVYEYNLPPFPVLPPLSHPSRIAEAGETSKPKKKTATFNSIPSLTARARAAAPKPEPSASGEPGLLAAARYFGGFVPRWSWNRPGCPVRITELEQVQLCFGGWIRSPLAALQVSIVGKNSSRLFFPFCVVLILVLLAWPVAWLRKSLLLSLVFPCWARD